MREGMLLHGPSGWGEFAPFGDYDDVRAARWLRCAIEAAYGSWPKPRHEAIAVNAIIPAVSSADAATLARDAVLVHGCTTVKVKVGTGLAEDEARVAAIRDVLTTSTRAGRIRLDANGAWTVDDAATALRRLGAYGIEYVEQPCADLDALRELRGRIDIPIAVDEPLRWADDPMDPALHRAMSEVADIAIIKAAPIGGVASGLELADALMSVGLGIVVSGSLDSSIGLASGIALADASSRETGASGLGTGTLLAADLIRQPIVPRAGMVPVVRSAPDPALLQEARERVADPAAWQVRLERAYACLATNGDSDGDAGTVGR